MWWRLWRDDLETIKFAAHFGLPKEKIMTWAHVGELLLYLLMMIGIGVWLRFYAYMISKGWQKGRPTQQIINVNIGGKRDENNRTT